MIHMPANHLQRGSVQMFASEANATNWTLVHHVLFNLTGLSEADHHWRSETLKKTVQISIKYIFVLK